MVKQDAATADPKEIANAPEGVHGQIWVQDQGTGAKEVCFIMENVPNCLRPFLGRNSMFWPLQEKSAVSPVELRRHSSSYGKAMEEQVGWHTSLVRGSVSFLKQRTDSYA